MNIKASTCRYPGKKNTGEQRTLLPDCDGLHG